MFLKESAIRKRILKLARIHVEGNKEIFVARFKHQIFFLCDNSTLQQQEFMFFLNAKSSQVGFILLNLWLSVRLGNGQLINLFNRLIEWLVVNRLSD